MLNRLRLALTKTLAAERALVTAGMVTAVGFTLFTLANMFAGVLAGWPEGPLDWESFLLGCGVWTAIFMLPIAFVAVRGTWVAHRVVTVALREELRARAIRADPQSAVGLPGFPEAEGGNLTVAETGGIRSHLEDTTYEE